MKGIFWIRSSRSKCVNTLIASDGINGLLYCEQNQFKDLLPDSATLIIGDSIYSMLTNDIICSIVHTRIVCFIYVKKQKKQRRTKKNPS